MFIVSSRQNAFRCLSKPSTSTSSESSSSSLCCKYCCSSKRTVCARDASSPPSSTGSAKSLPDSPPCGHYTKIYNPNVECERFIHLEYMNLYNNMVKIDKSNDPGRMLLSPLADKAFKLLAKQMEQDYDYAMQHRTELLQARLNDSTKEQLK